MQHLREKDKKKKFIFKNLRQPTGFLIHTVTFFPCLGERNSIKCTLKENVHFNSQPGKFFSVYNRVRHVCPMCHI